MTVVPPISPSASGPPLCGHSACVAKISPERVRNRARRRPATANVRPSPFGSCSTSPTKTCLVMLAVCRGHQRSKLIRGLWRIRFLPRIVRGVDRGLHRGVERSRCAFAVLDNDGANSFDSDSLDKGIRSFLVLGVLP